VREKDKRIHVGVKDTGVGIPKQNLTAVFEKFECLKDTRDRVTKAVPGSGLGLNIVYNSLKAQGGSIWVESEVDRGTTFVFSLPMAKGHMKASPHSNGLHPNRRDGSRQPVMMEKDRHVI